MRATNRRAGLWQTLVGALGLVVVVWVGGDLYDIVSSGSERPASGGSGGHVPPVEHGPAGGTPQDDGPSTTGPTSGAGSTDHGGGGQAPAAGGAHDPSQYDHG